MIVCASFIQQTSTECPLFPGTMVSSAPITRPIKMINASKWRTEVSVQTGSQNFKSTQVILKYVPFSHIIYFKYTSSKNFIIIMPHSLGLLQLKSENDKEKHDYREE